MEMKMQIQERESKKVFAVFKSQVEKVINTNGYESRFDQAFEYFIRVRFHDFKAKLNTSMNLLEKLLNEEELHSSNCKEAFEVIQTHFQSIFNPWVMRQSEFIDAFYQKFWVSYSTFRTKCINDMGELEKILEAEEAELKEIEKLKQERDQIDKEMQLKEREQIERERQLMETEVIERETEKDNQTGEETVDEGTAPAVSMVFKESDTSSEQQIESSSPRYDSDAESTYMKEAVWDTEDDHIRPSSDTEILATVQHSYVHHNVDIFDNMFVHDQTHPAHSESISDTYMVEQNDSNITLATPNMDPNGGEPAQDGSHHEQDRALFASLINNFKHELEKCKNDNREAKQANVFLNNELERFKDMEKRFENATKRNDELELEISNLKSQAQQFEMYGESVKPLLEQKEALEVGYREAVFAKNRSIQQLDEQMVLNNKKVKDLLKENSDLKSENSRLQKINSNFEIVNTKLVNENKEFLKRSNDLENKLHKMGQTSQTLKMLPTKDEDIHKQTAGIGFQKNDLENSLINETPRFLNEDMLFESEDILKSEEEKRLKVQQRKTAFSYHGFVYGCTQLSEIPKAPFKRKETNVKRFFKEAQLATYDADLWQNKARKQFCHLKIHIEHTLQCIWFKQENLTNSAFANPLSSDIRLKMEVIKILKEEIEPHVKNINLCFEYFENHLVTEMREDLKYVHSLEDEFDEKCLIIDIQKEFFTNQIESFKSVSVSHECENVNVEQTSLLKSENLCLKKKITELSKEAADVKAELSKRTAQFDKDLAKLEAQSISFQLKLQEKNEKTFSENSLTSVLKGKEKIFEENCDDTKIKFDLDELDTKNIELEHAVASLQKENEHLKQTYKNLFDSIKRSRVQNQISNNSDSQIGKSHLLKKKNMSSKENC